MNRREFLRNMVGFGVASALGLESRDAHAAKRRLDELVKPNIDTDSIYLPLSG